MYKTVFAEEGLKLDETTKIKCFDRTCCYVHIETGDSFGRIACYTWYEMLELYDVIIDTTENRIKLWEGVENER